MADQVVTLRINADGRAAVTAVQQVGKEVDDLGTRAERGGARAAAGMAQMERGAGSLQGVIAGAKAQVLGFVGAFASIQGARALAGLADSWSDMTSRVRLSIGAHESAAGVMDRLSSIARTTYSSIESTADAYARNSVTLRALGKSTVQQLDYTEALNNALVVSGAKGQVFESVQNALSKAMATGALRGEELNTVLNSGSRVAEVLADSLGTNVIGLRAMGEQGKITGDVIYDSLVGNMQTLAEEAESMPATIGDGFTLIRNAVLRTVGVFDQQNKVSEGLATRLVAIADHMDEVIRAAVTLAKVLATIYAAKLLTSAAAFTAELVRQNIAARAAASAARDMGIANDGAFKQSIKSVGKLGAALNIVGSAVAGWQIGTYLREEFRIVADAGDYLVYGIAQGWEELKRASAIAWESIKLAAVGAIDLILEAFAGMLREIASAANVEVMGKKLFGDTADGLGELADRLSGVLTPMDDYKAALAGISDEYQKNSAANDAMLADMQDATAATFAARDATKSLADAMGGGGGNGGGNVEGNAKAAKAYADAARELARALSEQRAELSPMDAAIEAYKQRITDANVQVAEWMKAGLQWADVQAYLRGEIEGAGNALSAQTAELAKQGDVLGNYLAEVADQKALIGMTARQKAVADAVRQVTKEYEANTKGGIRNAQSLGAVQAGAAAAAGELFDLRESAEGIEDILSRYGEVSGFDKIIGDIEEMGEALREALEKGTDTAGIERMQRAMGALRQEALVYATDTLGQGITSLQSMATEGTRAYQALEVAQTSLNLATAIGAIANQGMGDPYTAFARIAAMAAMMSQLVDGLTALGNSGPSSSSAEARQERQGTGTVLGDAEAKSESIANAVEITANATEQLVGLNRGMLNALLALQDAIGGASGMLARGAGDVDAADVNRHVTFLGANASGTLIGRFADALGNLLFGGKQKIIDQGILIAGGTLQEMIEGIAIGAYQTIETDGGLFGSDSVDDQLSPVSEEFTRQFQLIIGSIVDTVREGALALGLLPDEIEAAIAAFRVEEIRISLEGLSAEEQQKELEAVFSKLFDGLAGAVVPFIEQFQAVGEGLGETLVRIATEVQVVQEAAAQLGLAIDESDPERFAQLADGLVQATGGLDGFIAGLESFVSTFSSDGQRLAVAAEALASAFGQAGLTVPATADGMWDLMQSLDATTEQGREQIATLLRLADVAGQYYRLLEQEADWLDDLGLGADGPVSELSRELQQLKDDSRRAAEAAHAIAIAQGREGASARQLAAIHDWTASQIEAAIARLEAAAQDAAYALGLTEFGSADSIAAEIEALQARANAAESPIRGFGNAIEDAARKASDAINLLLGDLSPLNDLEKLEIARQALMRGQIEQEQFLQVARRLFGSSMQYEQEFQFAQRYAGRSAASDAGAGFGGAQGGLSAAERARLDRLLEMQQEAQAQQQLVQYQGFTRQLAEIAMVREEDWETVADRMGLDTDKLIDGLGLQSEEELEELIEHYQEQMKGTERVVETLREILAELRAQGEGAAAGDGRSGGTPAEPIRTPRDRDPGVTAGDGSLVDAVAGGVERGIERGMAPYIPRGRRQQVRA